MCSAGGEDSSAPFGSLTLSGFHSGGSSPIPVPSQPRFWTALTLVRASSLPTLLNFQLISRCALTQSSFIHSLAVEAGDRGLHFERTDEATRKALDLPPGKKLGHTGIHGCNIDYMRLSMKPCSQWVHYPTPVSHRFLYIPSTIAPAPPLYIIGDCVCSPLYPLRATELNF